MFYCFKFNYNNCSKNTIKYNNCNMYRCYTKEKYPYKCNIDNVINLMYQSEPER